MKTRALFNSYAYWNVLARLSDDDAARGHVQQIARKTGLSAGMTSRVLRELERMGMVDKEKSGNMHLYSLKPGYMTTEIKRVVFLAGLYDSGLVKNLLDQNEGIISIALYGSRARGDSMAGSDIDLLVIAPPSAAPDVAVPSKRTGLDINITTLSTGEFLRRKKDDKPFYNEVLRNHILLYGSELP